MTWQRAWELSYGAVGRLATGTGSLRVRLTSARAELLLLDAEAEVSTELRTELQGVLLQLSELEQLSEAEASAVAGRIVAFYDAIATDPRLAE